MSPAAYAVIAVAASRTSGRRSPTRQTANQQIATGNRSVRSPSQLLTAVLNQPSPDGPHPAPCKARPATYAARSSPIAHTSPTRNDTRRFNRTSPPPRFPIKFVTVQVLGVSFVTVGAAGSTLG